MCFPFRFTLTASLAALAVSAVARADEPEAVTARLDFRREPGAEGCLDTAGLERAVNVRWGRRVFAGGATADILLRGSIGRAPGGFRARIELERADGTSLGSREIATTARDCSALDDSIALAVGLMLDVSKRRIAEERRAATREASREPVVSGPPIAIPKDTAAPREPVHVEPWVSGEAALGFLPGLAGAARAGIAVEPRRFIRVEAAGSFFPSTEQRVGDHGARFSAWTAEVAVCPLSYRSASIGLHGCVSERYGQVRARGFGFSESGTATEPLSEVGLGAVATAVLASPLALRIGLRAEVPVVRYRFVFTDVRGETRVVYTMSSVTGSAELGLALRF